MQTAWGKGELGRAVDRVREKTEMLEKEAAAVAAAAAAVSVSSSQESKAIESARAASAIAAGVKAEVLSTVSTTVEGIILMHTQTSVQLSTSVLVVVETRAAEALKGK
ncbi:hypothetical protein K461DRAFT_273445 [Myriangium duriaei CBS 260.36]|uniref:Uncharacterized protein n=1 Tax=Myriangium duriaei CBS 260.36 TaxID=1168546 RepID=A0A9P4JE19_9PEZI|nr:hypothetical protein K461DRAFT_273445 [Myriangium duriaei CBS 260.36]